MGANRRSAAESPGALKTVDKALCLLEALARLQPVGVVALARELRVPKSRASRFLATLARRDYAARRAPDGRFVLGPKALELAGAALAGKLLLEESVAHARSDHAHRDARPGPRPGAGGHAVPRHAPRRP